MRCDLAERELSARLDGAGDRRLDAELASHLATCHRCRAFRERSVRVRELVRIRPAGPVPDLVPRIMAEVRRDAVVLPLRRWRPRDWGRAAAAFAAGVIAAAVVAGGLPAIRREPPPALATEIPRRIAEVSGEVTSYRATFHIVELGFHPSVQRRAFSADVAFRAPERFRARIMDRTAYPNASWPRNDIVLAVDADRWMLDAPRGCPREALPACAPAGRDVRSLRGRPPFDGDSPLPTDVVLPVRALAGTERVQVVGETEVLGRPGITIELAYRDATPLFDYLQAGGVWRPFFPHDRVLVTLDAGSWFPLAYEVRAGDSPERGLWAMRAGLGREPPGRLLFRAEVRSLGTGPPASWRPYTGTVGARDLGFVDGSFEDVAGRAPTPSQLGDLRPHRAGTIGREVRLSYADGLSWLLVRAARTWSGPALFGDVGTLAERVRLPGGGAAYYEPATGSLGRRLSIHAEGWDIALESNLPRDDLLEIAGSVPVRGLAVPARRLGRVPLAEALDAAPFALVPADLPAGYGLAAATLDAAGVALHFRRPGAELDGGGIRLYQADGIALPPPMDPEVLAVRVRGVDGRYSPTQGELEWIEGGVYRSVGGTALDLNGLLVVAESLEPPR